MDAIRQRELEARWAMPFLMPFPSRFNSFKKILQSRGL